MTPIEEGKYKLLCLASEKGKFAISIGAKLRGHQQEALETLQLDGWIRLIDVSIVANQDGVFRIFQVMPPGLRGYERCPTRTVTRLHALLLLCLLGACSPPELVPSARHDGTYRGTRVSDSLDKCGINTLSGQTSAKVARGHLSMPLFGPQSVLEGVVAEDGRFRASGYTPELPRRFPQLTVLTGRIENNVMHGQADNFGCHTEVDLRKVAQADTRPVKPKPAKPKKKKH